MVSSSFNKFNISFLTSSVLFCFTRFINSFGSSFSYTESFFINPLGYKNVLRLYSDLYAPDRNYLSSILEQDYSMTHSNLNDYCLFYFF